MGDAVIKISGPCVLSDSKLQQRYLNLIAII
jgi:hypothetical protein